MATDVAIVGVGLHPFGRFGDVSGIEMGAVADDLRLTIHAHPTLSEAMMEAAAVALGEAIHVINRAS